MSSLRTLVLISLLGCALLAACAGPQPLPVAPTPIPTLIPATMPAVPPSGQAASAAGTAVPAAAASAGYTLGKQVFQANCTACHKLTEEKLVGPGLGGLFTRKPDLFGGKPFSEENLIAWIKSGGGLMPSFSQLSDEELNGLVEFLRVETGDANATETAVPSVNVIGEPSATSTGESAAPDSAATTEPASAPPPAEATSEPSATTP